MRLTLLTTAGTILCAAADSPLHLLSPELSSISDPTLSCIQDINYIPPCDTRIAACWCQDTEFLTKINHCIKDASSGSVESTLSRLQKWCSLETPIQSTLIPSEDHGAHISIKSTINQFSKRYDSGRYVSRGSWMTIVGVCAAIAVVACIISCFLRGVKRARESHPHLPGNRLPVYEPNRGRRPPGAHPRPPRPRAEQPTRAPTPPPPYIRELEAAHVKNNSEEPGLPSYDDQPRGSNAV